MRSACDLACHAPDHPVELDNHPAGGTTCPARIGAIRKVPTRISRRGRTIPSCTSPTRRLLPTATGPEKRLSTGAEFEFASASAPRPFHNPWPSRTWRAVRRSLQSCPSSSYPRKRGAVVDFRNTCTLSCNRTAGALEAADPAQALAARGVVNIHIHLLI